MSIFSKSDSATVGIGFGRFSDCYKSPENVEHWNEACEYFNQQKYLDAYEAFLNYLKEDEVDNVKYERGPDQIKFKFPQGSKEVFGFADGAKVMAEVNVAQFTKLSVAFMRRLLDLNYNLNYSRSALKDNIICMKFDTSVIDGSPMKLYFAFKEIATQADRIDDLLIDEFSSLQRIDSSHIIEILQTEKEIKYKYWQKWIKETLDLIAKLNPDKLSGGISYLLLALCYKLDYLVAPEGTLMRALEKIHRIYFSQEERTNLEKNRLMIKEFENLLARPREKFFAELYRVKSTFALVNPTAHSEVINTIESELKNYYWYQENNYPEIVRAIFEYIPGYCLFNFGLHRPTRQFFHILFQVLNQEYFIELGIKPILYDIKSEKLNQHAIRDATTRVVKSFLRQYPNLRMESANLRFDDLTNFTLSYLEQIKNLNYQE